MSDTEIIDSLLAQEEQLKAEVVYDELLLDKWAKRHRLTEWEVGRVKHVVLARSGPSMVRAQLNEKRGRLKLVEEVRKLRGGD